ncbi:DUF3300 domain-containing protein [Klebsiella pneumoniae]|nr:DUF3300 domain-containing protein [Klebsiella pneumoniae]
MQSRTPARLPKSLRSKRQRPQRRRHSRWPPYFTPRRKLINGVAPIALYPGSVRCRSGVDGSTYPDNVLQAVQWSRG